MKDQVYFIIGKRSKKYLAAKLNMTFVTLARRLEDLEFSEPEKLMIEQIYQELQSE